MVHAAEEVRADQALLQAFRSKLAERIGVQKYDTWFRRGAEFCLHQGQLRVSVPNLFVVHWIETHYQAEIASAIQDCTGSPGRVLISVDPSLVGCVGNRQRDIQAQVVQKASEGQVRGAPPAAAPLRHRIEDFVVGSSNRLAYAAVTALAEGGSRPFNHVFLHGPCGVGKTHLLQGLCQLAGRAGQGLTWRFVTGEQFTNEFVSAIRRNQGGPFRARYRPLDLLAVDDVHFLSAKRATQEELLHTFNAIQSAGKRIVLASDSHPRLVSRFSEQLVSRFLAGMVVKIDPPDEPLRLEILRRRAAGLKLAAPPEVLEFIARHIRGSVRELEGSLYKLAAVAALREGPVSLELAHEALSDHLARTDSAITLGDIESGVAAFFALTPADLHSTRRTRTVSVARMVAAFLARRHTRMSFPEIGRFMGKNHSSVVLAVQKMERLLAASGELSWLTPAGPKALPACRVVEIVTGQLN